MDVVVVGFGAAGACAAIEAAESGAEVLVIDRFTGGGATAISGGIVYAGGGTRQQRAAGVDDTPGAMYEYLRHEVRDAVSPATLRRFCDESAGLLAWLEDHGVPFDASLCPYKTSYPTDRHYLYQSGSEHAHPSPAPRGHRTHAPGTSGGTLHNCLAAAAAARRVRFLPQSRAVTLLVAPPRDPRSGTATPPAAPGPAGVSSGRPPELSRSASAGPHDQPPSVASPGGRPGRSARVPPAAAETSGDSSGWSAGLSQGVGDSSVSRPRVVGVVCRTLGGAPGWARLAHRWLHRWSVKPGIYVPRVGRALHRAVAGIEMRYGRELAIRADAVVLAAGGFVFDREMMREHAPGHRGLRLGTPGDDGSGIRLGTSVGAGTRHLDRVTLWRFLTPPSALLGGLLVDRDGRRVCDESRYGAAIGDAVRACPGGKAWLVVDADVLREARRQLSSQTLWFQRWQSRWLFTARRTSARTLAELARRAGIDEAALAGTVAANNAAALAGTVAADNAAALAGTVAADNAAALAGTAADNAAALAGTAADNPAAGPGSGRDVAGKPMELVRPLVKAPFSLIDVSLRAAPAPMLTLGGLTVDEQTGLVLTPTGAPIPGLYAAGRTAVGICSASYVSGLSLADCVFSGRRAGRHAATTDPAAPATAVVTSAGSAAGAASESGEVHDRRD
ncbi:FAD-dependent oxidoreductase [Actinoplanes philippinensis]|uniref:FAD-dependent oxidoreductase n=1 Tax=Actinoplanes philippinensis TaxID=35752 RepID=UPI003F4D1C14